MKTKVYLIAAAGLLISFFAGMIVGLALANPGMSVIEVVGTIGKVDKYRNVRITEMDVELRNDLLADTSLKEAYKNYLLFEYTANIKMVDNIQFTIETASKIEGFRAANAQSLEKMEDYAYFLDNARLQILEAIATLDGLNGKSPIAIHTVMNNAGNAMAQTSYRSNVLFDFLMAVEQFFDITSREDHPELARAHDLLFANLFIASIVNENTPALNYLSGRELFTEGENLALKYFVRNDAFALDAKKLKIEFADQEFVRNFALISEQINTLYIVDQIRSIQFTASGQIGSFRSHSELLELSRSLGNAALLEDMLQSRADMLGAFPW